MKRTAHCCCGALQVETNGEPSAIVACHCTDCQRRTGAAFGLGAYFPKEQVRVAGESRAYVRDGQVGRKLDMHFCPVCGTTVYWALDLRPDHYGVAVGAFADLSFSQPHRSIWETFRHDWVSFKHDSEIEHADQNLSKPFR